MNATTTDLSFPKEIVGMFINTAMKAMDEAPKIFYEMIWSGVKQLLIEHWPSVILFLILILLFAVLRYLITGRWAMLGSVLYSYIYWGFVLIIILIFGPDIFASDWIKIVLFVVYVVSFTLVGNFLRKTGIRR
jgi:hypothetical protein